MVVPALRSGAGDRIAAPRIGFVVEQTLGHRTHAANLAAAVVGPDMRATWLPVDWDVSGLAARTPLYRSNWTVRAGVRARRSVARAHRAEPLDALFVHTQVPAVLLGPWMRRVPVVVSLDATPRQYDQLGAAYDHARSGRRTEALKWWMNHRTFERAAALVTWSEWARQGLIDGYGIDSDRVTVVPPGVKVAEWRPPPRLQRDDGVVRVLFVGGNFERKGGPILLEAVRRLRAEAFAGPGAGRPRLELDLVTQGEVPEDDGVRVHRTLGPNSPELRRLYHQADVFCLPTLGDCLPMVLAEAGAAGLPLVATEVGAVGELVRDGETGIAVPVGDVDALEQALRKLIDDAELRRRLGHGAAELVGRDHDSERNARRLLTILLAAAGSWHADNDVPGPVHRPQKRYWS